MRVRMIKVVPNPYSALDADGRAQGVVSIEGHPDRYVGANLDVEESKKTGKLIFKIASDPVDVPASPYYLRRLQTRELLPGDAETAKYAGYEDKTFEGAETVLAREKDRTSSTFEDANGRLPAFALHPKKTH